MLKARFLTAIVLAPLALAVLFLFPKNLFLLVIDAVLLIGAWEWSRLSGLKSRKDQIFFVGTVAAALALLHSFEAVLPTLLLLMLSMLFWALALVCVVLYPRASSWSPVMVRVLMGYAVLLPVWISLGALKGSPMSDQLILFLLLIVWAADSGAYFAGKTFGKSKLAPAVSPGKTREGLYGGLASCLCVGFGFALWFELEGGQLVYLMLLSVLTGMISVLGDLFESMLKRHQGIKDSSQLLPGHGGILDRLDSLTAAAPLFVLGVLLSSSLA